MQLSVRPDDLAAGASALRGTATALESAHDEFAATAARLTPQLGPHAADIARSTLAIASGSVGLIEGDLASYSRGLMAVAAYYAALDAHALGPLRVRH